MNNFFKSLPEASYEERESIWSDKNILNFCLNFFELASHILTMEEKKRKEHIFKTKISKNWKQYVYLIKI